MRSIQLLLLAVVLLLPGAALGRCMDSSEIVALDREQLHQYLESLPLYKEGCRITGFSLCDGSNPLEGLIFLNKSATRPAWNVFFFFDPQQKRRLAIAWVTKDGDPLPIPACVENCPSQKEPARTLYSQPYNAPELPPGSEPVMVLFPNDAWLSLLKK